VEEASSLVEGLWRAKQLSERVQLEADKAKEGVGTMLSLVPRLFNYNPFYRCGFDYHLLLT